MVEEITIIGGYDKQGNKEPVKEVWPQNHS